MFEERASMFRVPEPRVQARTPKENHELERSENETYAEKVARAERAHEIDVAHYDAAAAEHADLRPHMEHMKAISAAALEGWKNYYEQEAMEAQAAGIASAA